MLPFCNIFNNTPQNTTYNLVPYLPLSRNLLLLTPTVILMRVELLYREKSSLWRVCESSILIWNMEQELEATYWNGAKNLISTTVNSIACKFDALTDMEELHFGYNMELQPNIP